jgi:SAM-dependent methyltransferase
MSRTPTGWQCPECQAEAKMKDGIACFSAQGMGEEYSEFFQKVQPVEETYFWYRGRRDIIAYFMKRYLPARGRYLEIGCGTGFVAELFAKRGYEVLAGDSDRQALEFAQRRLGKEALCFLDIYQIPFREYFDVIGAYDVLEHVADDARALSQIFTALKPGGYVLLTVPQHKFLWSTFDEHVHHERRYDRKELPRKMRAAGFTIRRTTSFATLLLPLVYLVRLRSAGKPYVIEDDLSVGTLQNMIGRLTMVIERLLIGCHVPLPFGVSRLVLAQKPAKEG